MKEQIRLHNEEKKERVRRHVEEMKAAIKRLEGDGLGIQEDRDESHRELIQRLIKEGKC